jgi:hypothetical protein
VIWHFAENCEGASQFLADLVDSSRAGYEKSLGCNFPQIVVIDRTGTIRATSGGVGGDPKLEDADSLRTLIDTLLKESYPARH